MENALALGWRVLYSGERSWAAGEKSSANTQNWRGASNARTLSILYKSHHSSAAPPFSRSDTPVRGSPNPISGCQIASAGRSNR
jgi:hypothetical protein